MLFILLQASTDVPVSTELPALISTSALSVAIIQWMKNSALPGLGFINHDSPGMNRTLAWLAAFISGVGIHYHYDPALGALTITGLTLSALVATALQTAKSYGFNWFIYNVTLKGKGVFPIPPPVVENKTEGKMAPGTV
jgi:hypothetical protein